MHLLVSITRLLASCVALSIIARAVSRILQRLEQIDRDVQAVADGGEAAAKEAAASAASFTYWQNKIRQGLNEMRHLQARQIAQSAYEQQDPSTTGPHRLRSVQ